MITEKISYAGNMSRQFEDMHTNYINLGVVMSNKERNGHSRFQIRLEEDVGGSTGQSSQSWMETSSLWPILHWER